MESVILSLMTDSPILRTEGLRFLDKISYPDISVNEGEILSIEGPSGSGKSSLLRLFNATVSPSAGRVFYRGEPVESRNSIELRRELLLVSQAVWLFDESIEENFTRFHLYRESPAPTREQMRFWLSLAVADFALDRDCTSLSGGERQRVFIAICLSFTPRLLLLDEPTSALDAATGRTLMQNLSTCCRDKSSTIIFISHDRALSDEFAQKTISLEKGGKI